MFEKQLYSILLNHLQRFVVDLNEEQLKLSIWSGNLVLRDLQLQPTILDEITKYMVTSGEAATSSDSDQGQAADGHPSMQSLLLPFTVTKGIISELRLTIPWSALDREPVSIEVSGLDIVLAPLRARPYTFDEEQARVQALKETQLNRFERKISSLLSSASTSAVTSSNEGGLHAGVSRHDVNDEIGRPEHGQSHALTDRPLNFLEEFVNKIIRNVHVILRSVRLSYTFDYPGLHPTLANAVCIWMKEVYITTTDESFEDRFVYDLTLPICKKVEAVGISITVCSGKRSFNPSESSDLPGEGSDLCRSTGSTSTSTGHLKESLSMGEMEDELSSMDSKYHEEIKTMWTHSLPIAEINEFSVKLMMKEEGQAGSRTQVQQIALSFGADTRFSASFGAVAALWVMYSSLLDAMRNAATRKHLHLLNNTEDPRSNALKRWKFALNCVLDHQRSKRNGNNEDYGVEVRVDYTKFNALRKHYCELYKRSLGLSWLLPLSVEDHEEMRSIEKRLPLENILFLRSFARAEIPIEFDSIRLQRKYVEDVKKRKVPVDEGSRVKRVIKWFRPGKPTPEEENKTTSAESSAIDSITPEKLHKKFMELLQAFWRLSEYILESRYRSRNLKDASARSTVSVQNRQFQKSVQELIFTSSALTFTILPDYWELNNKVAAKGTSSAVSFLEGIHQYLTVEVKDVHFSQHSAQLENVVRPSVSQDFSLGSVQFHFRGALQTAILFSHSKKYSDSPSSRFVSVQCSESQKSVDIQPFIIVCRPAHEWKWWNQAMDEGMTFLKQWMDQHMSNTDVIGGDTATIAKGGNTAGSSDCIPANAVNLPWSLRVQGFEVLFPLSNRDYEADSLMNTCVHLDAPPCNTRTSITCFNDIHHGELKDPFILVSVPSLTASLGKKEGSSLRRNEKNAVNVEAGTTHSSIICEEISVWFVSLAKPNGSTDTILHVNLFQIRSVSVELSDASSVVNIRSVSFALHPTVIGLLNDTLIKPALSLANLDVLDSVTSETLRGSRWRIDAVTAGGTLVDLDTGMQYHMTDYKSRARDYVSVLCQRYYCHTVDISANTAELKSGTSSYSLYLQELHGEVKNTNDELVATVLLLPESNTAENLELEAVYSPRENNAFRWFFCHVTQETAISFGSLECVSRNNDRMVLLERLNFLLDKDGHSSITLSKFSLAVQNELVDFVSVMKNTAASFLPYTSSQPKHSPVSSQTRHYSFGCSELILELLVPSCKEVSTKILQLQFSPVQVDVTEGEQEFLMTLDTDVITIQKLEYGSLFTAVDKFVILSDSKGVVGEVRTPHINVELVSKTKVETGSQTNISFQLSGGQLSLYFPFLFELIQISNDPFYRHLQSIIGDSGPGYTLFDEQRQRTTYSRLCQQSSAGAPYVPTRLHLDLTISNMEVFLSTDCMIPINYSSHKTFFFMHVGAINAVVDSEATSLDTSTTVVQTVVHEICYLRSDSPNTLTTFLHQVDSTSEMKLNGNEVECSIRTIIAHGPESQPNVLSLSIPQLCSLAGVFQYNWMVLPDVAPSELVYKSYTIESRMPEFIIQVKSGGDKQFQIHFRNGTQYFFKDTFASISIEDVDLTDVNYSSRESTHNGDAASNSLPVFHVERMSVILNYSLPTSLSDEPTNRIHVDGISFWYRSPQWISLSRINDCLARSRLDQENCRKESFHRRNQKRSLTALPVNSFQVHVFSFLNIKFHFFEPQCTDPVALFAIHSATLRADMEQDLLAGIGISIEKVRLTMPSVLGTPSSALEVLAGCENMDVSMRRSTTEIAESQASVSIVSPWNIELRLQLPLFTIHADHYNRLIAYARYESATWGSENVNGVTPSSCSQESIGTTLSPQSPVLPQSMLIFCTGFEVSLPCKSCSLYVQQIEMVQKEIVEKNSRAVFEPSSEAPAQVPHSTTPRLLCARPSLNVRNIIIDVDDGNGLLKLPDIHCGFTIPLLNKSQDSQGVCYEGEVHVKNSRSSLVISENFLRHSYLLYMKADRFMPSIPLPDFYSESKAAHNVKQPVSPSSSTSPRESIEGVLHLIFDYPLECTVEGNLSPSVDSSNENDKHRSLLGIGRLLGPCRFTVSGKVTEQALTTNAMFYGNCEILDGDVRRLIFWSKENTVCSAATHVSPVLSIKVDVEDDVIVVKTVVDGVNFDCNARAVDFVVQVQRFYNRIISVNNAAHESIRQSATDEEDVNLSSLAKTKKMCVQISGRNISWTIDDTARLRVGDIGCKLQFSEQNTLTTREPPTDDYLYTVRLGCITLQHPCNPIQYAEISSGELVAGVGSITLRLHQLIGSNFDVYPRIAYRLNALQNYILTHVDLPKNIEKDFERKMLISITSVEARLWKDETIQRLKPNGYIRLRLPAVVMKAVMTSRSNHYSMDLENSVLEYVFLNESHPVDVGECFVILDKFCISVQHEEELIKRIQSTTVRCAKCYITIPTGSLLSDCMSNVFQTLFYHAREEKKLLNESMFLDLRERPIGAGEKNDLSSVESGKWGASRFSFYLPELQAALQTTSSASMLMAVNVRHFSLEWNISTTSTVTIVKIHTLSSLLDKQLFAHGPFIGGRGIDGAVDPQSKDGIYLRLEKLLTAESRTKESSVLPSEKVTITGRLNNFEVTLSPDLLNCFNAEVLSPIASAANISFEDMKKEHSAAEEHRYSDMLPIRAKENLIMDNNVVVITSDVVISSDFFIGGDKSIILHFKKNRSARFPRNVINVSSMGGATIFVSPVMVNGKHQPSIIVEDGLTVNFIKTRLSLSSTTPDKAILLGARSLFNIDPLDLITRTAAVPDVQQRVIGKDLDHIGQVFRQVDVDVVAGMSIILWAKIDKLTVKTKAIAQYHLEKIFVESNPQISDYLDEHGSVQFDQIAVESNTRVLTEQGFRIVADVQHKRLDDQHGVSIINLHLPVAHLSLTLMQLCLFRNMEKEIQKSIELVYKTCTENQPDNESSVSSQSHSHVHNATERLEKPINRQRSLLELTLSSPSLSLTLLNELSGKVGVASVENTKIVVEGDRNLSHLTCQLHSSIIVQDFPPSCGGASRNLISVAPDMLLTSSWYGDGSTSLEIALTCAKVNFTVPLVTLHDLSHFHFSQGGETSEPFVLQNDLGAPVTVMLFPSSACHLLESGARVATDFYVGRTTPLRVLLGDKRQFIKEHNSEMGVIGDSVDFCKLQGGATIRIPMLRSSIGVLDTVFRMLDTDRVVHMTSSVMVENAFQELSVELSDRSVWHSGQCGYISLDALTLPLRISVGPFKLLLDPPQKLSLESIISAFLLLRVDNLKNIVSDVSKSATCLVSNDIAKICLRLKKTEECDTMEGAPDILNVALILHKRIAHEQKVQLPSVIPKYEVYASFSALYTLVNLTGSELRVGSSGAPLGSSSNEEEIVEDAQSFNFFPRFTKGDERIGFAFYFSLFNLNIHESRCHGVVQCDTLQLHTSKVIPLMKGDGSVFSGIVAEHAKTGIITLRSVGMVQNHLSTSVCVQFTRGSSTSEVIELTPESRIPIYIPLNLNHPSSVDEPMYMKIAKHNGEVPQTDLASTTLEWSDVFLCNAPVPPTTLSTKSAMSMQVLVVSSFGLVLNDNSVPMVSLMPKWCIQNHLALPLQVRLSKSPSETHLIQPGETNFVLYMPLSTSTDPEIQLRVVDSENEMDWSPSIKLGTLCSASSMFFHWKYRVPANTIAGELKAPLFEISRVPTHPNSPMEDEWFINLTLSISSNDKSQCILTVGTDEQLPLVIENRTNIPLQIRELVPNFTSTSMCAEYRPPWAYFIPLFSDVGMSLDSLMDAPPSVRIDLLGGNESNTLTLDNLSDAAVSEEVLKMGASLFVTVTVRPDSKSFIITFTENQLINHSILSPSRGVVHIDLLIENVALYVASPWIHEGMDASGEKHILSLVRNEGLRISNTTGDVVEGLRENELDLILCQITGFYAALSLNERHIIGNGSVGRVEVLDCTSPIPVYPVVFSIGNKNRSRPSTQNSTVASTPALPCISSSFHVLRPRKIASTTGDASKKCDIIKVLVKELRVEIGEVWLRAHDTFLYILSSAGKRLMERQRETRERLQSAVDERSTTAVVPETIYDFTLNEVYVSSVDFSLTITRRADGLLNPFKDLSKSMHFIIPSVENAPITLPYLKLSNSRVRSVQPSAIFSNIVWPSYRAHVYLQVYKVIGSMELLGNPVALVSGWGRGVRSLLAGTASLDPLKGAQGFMKEAACSTLHSVGLLSHVGSQVASRITFDDHWVQRETEYGLSKPPSVVRGVAQGIVDGIGGVFQKPLSGARDRGVQGFFSGVAGGVAGLVSRPLSGVLRSVGDTAQLFILLMNEPPTSTAVLNAYMNSDRNFIKSSSVDTKGASFGKSDSTAHFKDPWRTGEYMTAECFASALQALNAEGSSTPSQIFSTINSHVGPHNVALHCDWETVQRCFSEEEMYDWMEIILIGCCGRCFQRYLHGHSLGVSVPIIGGVLTPVNNREVEDSLSDHSFYRVIYDSSVEAIKDSMPPKLFQQCSTLVVKCTADSFTSFLHGSIGEGVVEGTL